MLSCSMFFDNCHFQSWIVIVFSLTAVSILLQFLVKRFLKVNENFRQLPRRSQRSSDLIDLCSETISIMIAERWREFICSSTDIPTIGYLIGYKLSGSNLSSQGSRGKTFNRITFNYSMNLNRILAVHILMSFAFSLLHLVKCTIPILFNPNIVHRFPKEGDNGVT